MIILMIVFFILNIPLLMANSVDPRCFWKINLNEVKDIDLDTSCYFILEAGQLPMEKDYFNQTLNVLKTTKYHKYALALAFTVDEINRNPDLLPNMSLIIKHTLGNCDGNIPRRLLNQIFHMPFPNYVCNEETMCSFMLMGPKLWPSVDIFIHLNILFPHFLQISYGPFHSIFSDNEQFPYIYQMTPKDTSLALAMVSFILYFNWNWVGLVISDNDEGNQFLTELKKETENTEICFAFVNMMAINENSIYGKTEMYYNQIVMSTANVIIIYGERPSIIELCFRTWTSPVIQRIWVTKSELYFPTSKRDFTHGTFYGTLAFQQHHDAISGFKNFVHTWYHLKSMDLYLLMPEWSFFKYESSASYCKILMSNSSNVSLAWLMEQKFDIAFNDNSHSIYNAVYAMAHALHEKNLQQIDNQEISYGKRASTHCLKLHSFLRKIHFTNPFGERVIMKERVRVQEDYDIVHMQNCSQHLRIKVKIGQFSPYFPHGGQFHLYEDMIDLATGSRKMPSSMCSADCRPGYRKFWKEGMAACCFVCSPCPENEISNETTVVLWVFVKHHDTPIVKANNRILSYILIMSLMFCFLCSFFFIGHPNRGTCILQQITFGIVFTVAVSTVLAKTITVLLAFQVTDTGRKLRNFLVSGTPNYIIPICSLLQCTLCAIWLSVSPPFVDIDEHSEHGHIIIVCNKGSVMAFYCVLGYLALLALGSFMMAFLAKNLPDTFNEAKFLTFSMLVFCSVWITFLPVYHSTKGRVMVAVEIFSILTSSAGMLGCIFAPKIYIILMKPERNSIQKFREKSRF
ncbi:vomeronasal type-2 receptor 116-like isoform X3 [Rattus rattus]|uniref:vomeronasal type-2 receptor 116-like isoform X3 n=1 Tax=Rattus rattus TaxID=10117 RepID=UPI0013F39944|nr:vomeronasal type-2 receptor 116-like isoform X3 [Rattus rattus]